MIRIQLMFAFCMALLAAQMPMRVYAADDQALPWDGRFQDLTVDTLTKKYLTHILTNRQHGTVKPDQWTTVAQQGRSRAFNDDTGVASLAVDAEAIFGGQTNFCRSELVQNVAGNTAGTTFFRVSLMKKTPYINLHSWQVVFPESHLFEVRIDASVDPVQLIWYTGGSTETRWSVEFKTKTWYNFGIAVSKGKLALYFSEGDDDLVLTKTESYNGDVPKNYEFHFGQLTLSNDGSAVKMVDGKQDVLFFSGVSVDDSISSSGSLVSNSKSSHTSSIASADSPPTSTSLTNTKVTSSSKPTSDNTNDATNSAKTPAADSPSTTTDDESTGGNDDVDKVAITTSFTDPAITSNGPITSKLRCKVRRSTDV